MHRPMASKQRSAGVDEPVHPTLHRALGRTAAIALVLGSVIGSGIFFKPQVVAEQLGSFGWILTVWIVAGVLCLLGALSLAELAAMLPRAGGLYVYLQAAYGRLVAFLYGWSLFLVVRPAATGALATAFAAPLELPPRTKFFVSVGVLGLLAGVNVVGVVWGGRMQNVTTAIKVGFLLVIAVLPWLLGGVDSANFASTWTAGNGAGPTIGAFMVALLAVMFAYNSWHEITPLAEEIVEPQRNIPWALLVGVSTLVVLYVSANIAYHGVLSVDQIVAEKDGSTAEVMMELLVGPTGATVMMILVMCSVFGTINANLLHAPRVYFAMGRDRVFFPALGRVHARFRTPALAILCQTGLAMVLMIISTYIAERGVFDQLTNVVVFTGSVFYVLAVFAVIVLRRTRRDLDRPYRTLGYPWTPLLFVAAYCWFIPMIFAERVEDSLIGLVVVAVGIPAYFVWSRPGRRVVVDRS